LARAACRVLLPCDTVLLVCVCVCVAPTTSRCGMAVGRACRRRWRGACPCLGLGWARTMAAAGAGVGRHTLFSDSAILLRFLCFFLFSLLSADSAFSARWIHALISGLCVRRGAGVGC
jgi:hypothetical protein